MTTREFVVLMGGQLIAIGLMMWRVEAALIVAGVVLIHAARFGR